MKTSSRSRIARIAHRPVRRIVAAAAAGLLLASAAGCVAPSFGSKMSARQVSEVGDQAASQIASQYLPASPTEPGVAQYKAIAAKLARRARGPGATLRFAAIESDEELAISLPDGHIYLSSGLLAEIANDPNQIACVVAEEIGHVALHQDIDNLTAALGDSDLTDMLTEGQYQDVVNTELELCTQSYSQAQEYDTDRYAVQLAAACGYDATALVRFLNRQIAQPHLQSDLYWDESHPISKSRVSRVEQDIRRLPRSARAAVGADT